MNDRHDPYETINRLATVANIDERLLRAFYDRWKRGDVADHYLFASSVGYFERDPETFGVPEPRKPGIVLLVCGGRNFRNSAFIHERLTWVQDANGGVRRLVTGGAKGTDRRAAEWATANNVIHRPYYPDWDAHGRSAGPIRNAHMLAVEKPDLVVAFPGGRGTGDMIGKATLAGVMVMTMVPGQATPAREKHND